MKVNTFVHRQLIKKNIKDVFPFFENPLNLAKITPADLGFKILTPSPIIMGNGAIIDYVVRILGVPVRWTSLISDYQPPHKFVDLQIKGPYSYWHHTHVFTEHPEGTMIEDRVLYALPFGLLGSLMHALIVKRQLEQIFSYREKVIGSYFQT